MLAASQEKTKSYENGAITKPAAEVDHTKTISNDKPKDW
jgi:hypothetical protein